jgi:drug/metabolite transporter (DMT)-like permease
VSETIFALFYSFLWDGQWPSATQWLATGLFMAGILASVRAHR